MYPRRSKDNHLLYKVHRLCTAYTTLAMTPDELASLNGIGHDILQAFAAIMGETFLLSNKPRYCC
jgi:hypothetical protein